MVNYYDELEIEDFAWDPVAKVFHYPCPCGDRFEISKGQLRDGEEIATCPSCSLIVRVIYDYLDWEDYVSSDEEDEEDNNDEEEKEEKEEDNGAAEVPVAPVAVADEAVNADLDKAEPHKETKDDSQEPVKKDDSEVLNDTKRPEVLEDDSTDAPKGDKLEDQLDKLNLANGKDEKEASKSSWTKGWFK